jgi:RNA polymerase sigma factor (TIGR02999 family)
MSEEWETPEADHPQTIRTLVQQILRELKVVASRKLRDQPPSESLTPTGLVHEVYLRFTQELGVEATWQNRVHFLNAAAKKMNHILIDRARRRHAAIRGGRLQRVPLDDAPAADDLPTGDWSDLHAALEALERVDDEAATVIRWRYLLDLPLSVVTLVLNDALDSARRRSPVSLSTVDRARRRGLEWLRKWIEAQRT